MPKILPGLVKAGYCLYYQIVELGNQSSPHHDNNTYFLLVESFSMLIRMLLYKSYFTKERIFLYGVC